MTSKLSLMEDRVIDGPNPKLIANLRWFLDNLDRVPETIHVRGVWRDPKDGAGSQLGSKMTARAFADWIERSEKLRQTERVEVQCFHVGVNRDQGETCTACAVFGEDGQQIAEGGTRVTAFEVYRWPMRAAIARLADAPVRPTRPPLDVTLRSLARHSGDIESTLEALARRWPSVGDPTVGYGHVAYALNRVRRVYRVEVPASRPVEKSDSQLNAESL